MAAVAVEEPGSAGTSAQEVVHELAKPLSLVGLESQESEPGKLEIDRADDGRLHLDRRTALREPELQLEDRSDGQPGLGLHGAARHGDIRHGPFAEHLIAPEREREIGREAVVLAAIRRLLGVARPPPEGLEPVTAELAAERIDVRDAQQALDHTPSVGAANEVPFALRALRHVSASTHAFLEIPRGYTADPVVDLFQLWASYV